MKLYKLTQEVYTLYGNIRCNVDFPHGAQYGSASGLRGMLTDIPALWADEDVECYHISTAPDPIMDITMV